MDGPMLYKLLKDFGIRGRGEFFEVVKIDDERHTLKHIKDFKKIEDALDMIVSIFNKRQARREEYNPVDAMVFGFGINSVLKKFNDNNDIRGDENGSSD